MNNIAVPLAGFAEYALQQAPRHSAIKECVEEFLIGTRRIRALATDLEILSQTDSIREAIVLGDCVRQALAGSPGVFPKIEWGCPQDIKLRVDPWHAGRAITALLRAAMDTESDSYPGTMAVARKGLAILDCAVCDASLRPEGDWVFVRTSVIRRLSRSLLRDPFRSDIGGRISRRLAFAVLERCAHRAGGHIALDQDGDGLTLALPIS